MANILTNILQQQLSDNLIDQLSSQLGPGVNKQQTATAAAAIMSTMLGAMARNTSSDQGAASLNNALARDHDGSILDNVVGMLTGQAAPTQNSKALNGIGILEHVLGGRQSAAVDMISRISGLDQNSTGRLMVMLAPIVMGMLGKAKQQNNLDGGGLADVLSGFVKESQQGQPAGGLLGQLLDSDGDGSVMDDVADMGMKFLGGFFNKGR